MNKEKELLSEILGSIDAYDMHKAKKGLTITIQVIEKDKAGCCCTRKEFRGLDEAVAYVASLNDEEKNK